MKAIADLCVIPIGVGVSVSKYVAEASRILEASDLDCQLHAYGTNVEGDYDLVFKTLKTVIERLHAMGVPRVSCTVKLGTRSDREQSMADKIRSVEEKLAAGE